MLESDIEVLTKDMTDLDLKKLELRKDLELNDTEQMFLRKYIVEKDRHLNVLKT